MQLCDEVIHQILYSLHCIHIAFLEFINSQLLFTPFSFTFFLSFSYFLSHPSKNVLQRKERKNKLECILVFDKKITMLKVFGVTGKALCLTSLPTVFCFWRRIAGDVEDYRPHSIYCNRGHTDLTSFRRWGLLPFYSYSTCMRGLKILLNRNLEVLLVSRSRKWVAAGVVPLFLSPQEPSLKKHWFKQLIVLH